MTRPRKRQDDENGDDAALRAAMEREDAALARGVPEFGLRGREPVTQGERLRWIRSQLGADMWTPMNREQFVKLLHYLAQEGQSPRAATTVFRWEKDQGRGPTLKEGVVLARLVGRTAEWLSGLDEYHAALRHGDEIPAEIAARILKQGYGRGGGSKKPEPEPGSRESRTAAPGHGPTSSTTRPEREPARKQAGRKRR